MYYIEKCFKLKMRIFISSKYYVTSQCPMATAVESVYSIEWAGRPGFGSRQGLDSSPSHFVQAGSGPLPQPPIQWVPGVFTGVNWPGREANNSPLSNAEVKNAWSYTSTPPIRLHGAVKHRDNFTSFLNFLN
jgi:hypothetical protein